VAVNFQCVIGFAIRVDKGNNMKGGFNKKLSEGLTFLRDFVDPAVCILPNRKDKRLGPIKSKSDLPKYQLTMRNYFNIPNQMASRERHGDQGLSNHGLLYQPQELFGRCGRGPTNDGLLIIFKKCQEVDTVPKLILLGVPTSIEEEVIKDTLDKVLSELECMLLQTDSKYKLTKDQRQNWINYVVNREFPPGMPWEDAEEKKKKQGDNNAWLAYVLQVYQPDYD